ncbi:flagellar basal body L-ring protein FlgH [Marinibaculum pumilum]|uniref:Flagellar L-ring protein n=1 Tax=Marinibaculum pumilum TaxID=1766165 RepID=A0ABV7L4U6_9PROT
MTTTLPTLTAARLLRFAGIAGICLGLGACNAIDRISRIGEEPQLAQIENPTEKQGYKPVSLPMPRPEPVAHAPNSLWRPGSRAFFKDQRANRVGDLLTVTVNIDESAQFENSTTRNRTGSEGLSVPQFFGYDIPSVVGRLPGNNPNADPDNLAELGSNSASSGSGTIDREETINLSVAAIVTQVLPNGNLVIMGRQELRVNYEVRELLITGIVRPEDITAGNAVPHTKIAEARLSYGGRGVISDVQQPRYGQQLFDIIFPW